MAETKVLKAVDFNCKSQVIERVKKKISFQFKRLISVTKGQILWDSECIIYTTRWGKYKVTEYYPSTQKEKRAPSPCMKRKGSAAPSPRDGPQKQYHHRNFRAVCGSPTEETTSWLLPREQTRRLQATLGNSASHMIPKQ